MKKIMMAVAIVCAAVCTQAATVNWSASALVDSKGDRLNESKLGSFKIECAFYVFNTESTKWELYKTDTGEINSTGVVNGSWIESEGLVGGTTYHAILKITDKNGAYLESSEAVFTSVSGTKSINFATGSGFTPTGSKIDNSGTDKGWKNVPEPTSAMLMLVGMAGLALRRRRA